MEGADVLVVSSAVPRDNPEVIAATARGIPVVPRAEMLAELMRFRHGIAVAGSHGKTTTTSLIASLLAEGGLDPTFVVGGRLNSTGTHARLGSSCYLVAEADESDASFLCLQPMIAVLTNVEAEHLPHYDGDFQKLKKAFVEFLHHLPFYGLAVVCEDDPGVSDILKEVNRPIIRYGLGESADVRAVHVECQGLRSHFTVLRKLREGERQPLDITLNLPGSHNVLNALAAIAVATEEGVEDEAIAKGLASFQGIGRRFQVHGPLHLYGRKFLLIDDYGHHPTELAVTIDTIRSIWPDRRLVMVFQPHRYTRTRDSFDEFSQVLSKVPVLLMLEVYSAGEDLISGADSRVLCRSIRQRGWVEPIWVESASQLPEMLSRVLKEDDILLMQGAGSIGKMAKELIESAERELDECNVKR
jgi:UDP-N-acetylmuramate--alanine ligase